MKVGERSLAERLTRHKRLFFYSYYLNKVSVLSYDNISQYYKHHNLNKTEKAALVGYSLVGEKNKHPLTHVTFV